MKAGIKMDTRENRDMLSTGLIKVEGVLHKIEDLTFKDVSVMYGTGKSFQVMVKQEKTYYYRHGCMTKIGDIEQGDWKELIDYMIKRDHEELLFKQLYEWELADNYGARDSEELRHHVLDLHATRIFDCPYWVDYIAFNQRYRPEVLDKSDLVEVVFNCCQKQGFTTRQLHETQKWRRGVKCQYCGSYTDYKTIDKEIKDG